ncbi:MAG TPA: SDR family NAD(P)-dependent oxidoreductase [Polyangium sp.]|nr:SDR family NAD(P)-dependent oxidoreductase [Polyangium sp.]
MKQSRLAIVTGSNRGIGLEIARQLVQQGLRVIATARDTTSGAKAAADIGAEFERLDVASSSSIDEFVARRAPEGLDVFVANAGIALDGFNADVARRTIDVNYYGAQRVVDQLLPSFRPGSRIVMVSSGMGELSGVSPALQELFAAPNLDRATLSQLVERFIAEVQAGTHAKSGFPSSAYRVSKIALNAYVRILARDLSTDPRRILVNATCPGWVKTRMGGDGAPTSVEDGAKTPVWLALLPEGGPSGGFFRQQKLIPF